MFLSDYWSGWKRGNSREPVPDVDPVERESFALCQGRGDDGLGIGLQRDSPMGRISVAKENPIRSGDLWIVVTAFVDYG
jgi:hypothetical protein